MSMKLIVTLLITTLLFSCQSKQEEKEEIVIGKKQTKVTPEILGKKIFNGKGKCFSCHQVSKKSIGPSIKEIAKVYKEKNGDLIRFMKEEDGPIVAPESFAVMKTNYAILKTFTDQELEALEAYMKKQ